ncbi:MAG TPA: hypothetical protein VGM21_15905 [Actinomycetota bacterium]
MLRLVVILAGVLLVAGCTSAGTGGEAAAAAGPPRAAQAAGAALAFAAHSDPEVAVVDGYAALPPAVQRGEQPIDLVRGHADPCARRPGRRFTAAERDAIGGAFHGRSVRFVADPAAALRARRAGALVLATAPPLLAGRRGTVMVVSCVPGPQQVLVNVEWDGHAWRVVPTAAG